MKIAIIGSGISGLTCAYLLSQKHQITVFEKDDWFGGHTHTVPVQNHDERQWIDTGFIIFNKTTYPLFCQLLAKLNIPYQKTDMSFSVTDQMSDLSYAGGKLKKFFNHGHYIVRASHWRLLWEINRFNHLACKHLQTQSQFTLSEFLEAHQLNSYFRKYYLEPLVASVWSVPDAYVGLFPARYLFEFMQNHGLLTIRPRSQWYVIRGGSRQYVDELIKKTPATFLQETPVRKIDRLPQKVMLHTDHKAYHFDAVILATHSDQALSILSDATDHEVDALSNLPYQTNYVTLHGDTEMMPPHKPLWSSWNYVIGVQNSQTYRAVTYHMNRLQSLKDAKNDYFVTLSHLKDLPHIRGEMIHGQYTYAHPIWTSNMRHFQKALSTLNGQRRTYYCGAYCGHGFHEDGVKSAVEVCHHLGVSL